MKTTNLYLGIDFGTSGVRAIAINNQAQVIANTQLPLPSPKKVANSGIEQEPHIWWEIFCELIKLLREKITLTDVKSISIDGTSGTVLLTDSAGNPLAPALMYNDSRAIDYVKELNSIAPSATPVLQAGAGLPKLMWLYDQPCSNQAQHALHQSDWIMGKLSGDFAASDSNNCLKTGYDIDKNHWPDWIKDTNVPVLHLPGVYKPGTSISTVKQSIATELGFSETLQVVSGTTDSTAALIATGANKIGDAVTSLGSTLVMKVIHDKPISNKDYGIYSQPYYINNELKWLVGGASNSGGAILRKYFTDDELSALSNQIDTKQACALDYYPLLQPGERFPFNDPDKQPVITPRPDDDVEFLYGLFNGIANIEKLAYQRLAEFGAPYPNRIFSVGGGSINPVWTLIRQRKLNCEMIKPEHTDAAYGAALLALRGAKA